MANRQIREEATKRGVRLWQIATVLHLSDGNFSRKLRRELPEDEQQRIIKIINEIAEEEKV